KRSALHLGQRPVDVEASVSNVLGAVLEEVALVGCCSRGRALQGTASVHDCERLRGNGCAGGELPAESLAFAPEERGVSPLPVGERAVPFALGCRKPASTSESGTTWTAQGLDDTNRVTRKQSDNAKGIWLLQCLAF